MTYKIHPVRVKNTRCHKTFLVKHFLFGALAWKTVDVRHKPFLFSLHLTCSVFQQGASSRPGPKHFSGRCDVPMLPAPVSLLFLQNSCTWMVLFQQRWGVFFVFWVLFGVFCFCFVLFWGGFGRNEEGITYEGLQDLTCSLFFLGRTRGLQRLTTAQ